LTEIEAGTGLASLHEPLKPRPTEPLVATSLFQLRLLAVTWVPDWDQSALQP
jgi:hypothetical protein